MKIKLIGNTADLIDWDRIILTCQENFENSDKNTVTSVVDRSEAGDSTEDNWLLDNYRSVIGNWKNAGYNLSEIVWYDYYPGQHFPMEIQEVFSKFVGAEPLRVFISEVLPGAVIPYHWDVEDKEQEWLANYGQLYRYVCCIDKPKTGAGLFFDEDYLYLNKQGDVYEWANYKDHHSSANSGEHPSYYFHFLGYKK